MPPDHPLSPLLVSIGYGASLMRQWRPMRIALNKIASPC